MNSQISQQQKINSFKKQIKAMNRAIKELEIVEKDNQMLNLMIEKLTPYFYNIKIEKDVNKEDQLKPIDFKYHMTLKTDSQINENNYSDFFANFFDSKYVTVNKHNAFQVHVSPHFSKKIMIYYQTRLVTPSIIVKIIADQTKYNEVLNDDEKQKVQIIEEQMKLERQIENKNNIKSKQKI